MILFVIDEKGISCNLKKNIELLRRIAFFFVFMIVSIETVQTQIKLIPYGQPDPSIRTDCFHNRIYLCALKHMQRT